MKTKLTITIDRELLPKAKQSAARHGVSLSQMIENALRQLSKSGNDSFSTRWRGAFRPAARDDERYRRLAGKYL
jgi:hypothetical protein